jgi:hypothetical protein
MARRRAKKTVKRRSSKRRSVGAVGANMLMEIGGIVAGAVVAKQLNKMLKFDPKILAAGKIVAGVALPKFVKNPLMAGIGQGMIAIGGMELVGSFVPALGATDDLVILSGIEDDMMMSGIEQEFNSSSDIETINGGFDISEVNGFDEY